MTKSAEGVGVPFVRGLLGQAALPTKFPQRDIFSSDPQRPADVASYPRDSGGRAIARFTRGIPVSSQPIGSPSFKPQPAKLDASLGFEVAKPRQAAAFPDTLQRDLRPSLQLTGHNVALDGIRGVAILMVLAHHFVPTGPAASFSPIVRTWLSAASLGASGVDLFFVLSGLLITGILLEAKGSVGYFRNFYARRTLRIFPLYYAVLIAAFVLLPRAHHASAAEGAVAQHQVWLWTYTSNFFDGRFADWQLTGGWLSFDHFWSLCVEEHFYIVWPLAVFALNRGALWVVSVGLIVVAPVLRWALYAHGNQTLAFYLWTPCRMDGLAMGALLALLGRTRWGGGNVRAWAWAAIALGCGWIAVTAGGPARVYVYATSQMTLIAAGVIALAVTAARTGLMSRLLSVKPLVFLGKYSYAIYVLHLLLFRTVVDRVVSIRLIRDHVSGGGACHAALLFGVGVGCSALAGWMSWHGFEKHFLKLKRHFAYRRANFRTVGLAA